MIEISHQQAQYLIRQSTDRRLPDAQWAALADHLAQCESCRAYQDQRIQLARSARRLFVQRWQGVDGPGAGMPEAVLAQHLNRSERRLSVFTLAGMLLLLLVVALASRPGAALNPLPAATALPTRAAPAPSPTPPAKFHGIVAFQANVSGDSEIYLLNTGPAETEVINLTQNPAEDTSPAWSPDGDWLAFISDRSGQPEVYVISVAGTRLTQLTNDPGMVWSGPLAWSQNGRWLALIGLRDHQADDAWVYLIPLRGIDGDTTPLRLPGTHNITGPLRFYTLDAYKNRLLSSVPANRVEQVYTYLVYPDPVSGVLMRYDLQVGRVNPLNFEETRFAGLQIKDPGSFAYTVNNREQRIFYLAEKGPLAKSSSPTPQAAASLRRAVIDVNTGESRYTQLVITAPGRIRAVSDLPTDPRIAYLTDFPGGGCYLLNLFRDTDYEAPPPVRTIPDLCVDGGLDPAQWQSDARWVLVQGHRPGEAAESLYALNVGLGDQAAAISMQRLQTLETGSSDPRVRPDGVPSLGLDPKPAAGLVMPVTAQTLPLALVKTPSAAGPDTPASPTQPVPAAPPPQPSATRTPALTPNPQPGSTPSGSGRTRPDRTINRLTPR